MDIHVPHPLQEKQKPRSGSRLFSVKILLPIALLMIVCFGVGVAVLGNDEFQITNVSVYGTETFYPSEVIAFTEGVLSGNYVSFVPRSSSILFSKEQFEKQLQKTFPVIEVVYVTFDDPHTLSIHIKERKPHIVWCFEPDDCGFVDRSGILYSRAPVFSDGVYSLFASEPKKSFSETLGTQIIDPAIMNRFTGLFNDLQSDDIVIARVIFLENNDVAFSVEQLFGQYPNDYARLLGTIEQNDEVFLRDVVTGLGHDAFMQQYQASPMNLEYIDMRFPGKILYKFMSNSTPLENNTGN